MKLNTTSQYAIKILTFIVTNKKEDLCNAKKISEELNIPYKYLTKIMTKLVNANILESVRGQSGGYLLSKEPTEIKMVHILNAVDEFIEEDRCLLSGGKCNDAQQCVLHNKWQIPKNALINIINNTTLKELAYG